MKLRIITKRQLAAEEHRFREEHRSKMEIMKLCGRLLTVTREARDYLKASGPRVGGDRILDYDDLMANLSSILDRKDSTWNQK